MAPIAAPPCNIGTDTRLRYPIARARATRPGSVKSLCTSAIAITRRSRIAWAATVVRPGGVG